MIRPKAFYVCMMQLRLIYALAILYLMPRVLCESILLEALDFMVYA